MSEPKLISPMLDNFAMGDPISDHSGVRCCPAMDNTTGDKYIVKIISTPASQTQVEAMLLSGAYPDKVSALEYYKTISDSIEEEVIVQQKLSQLEGFLAFDSHQVMAMEDGIGFDIYLLSKYRNTLAQKLRHSTMRHLEAINLALDLCAALSVCRRSGYLYVNLKPENIYFDGQKGYRIGDVGFVKLSSLKYASLPDRYRSSYTAPEITDAFSYLNTTMDTYALGLILYQVFNDSLLPIANADRETPSLVPPAYADYEMAEIILKACASDPAERYQDPVEMGQAIVSYMQRNGANDTPIAPVSDIEVGVSEEATKNSDVAAEINPEDITEESIYTEDADGNLTMLEDEVSDETSPEQLEGEITYEEVSDEVTDILNHADDLLAHPTPEPVVQPEPIDVPIPEPILVETATEETIVIEQPDLSDEDSQESEANEIPEEGGSTEDNTEEDIGQPRKSHWLRNIFITFLVIAILIAGFFFYTKYYLQPIESIVLEEGRNCNITVNVNSKIDEDKLTVICSDTYGNQLTKPVVDGRAYFEGLAPNAAYTIKVIVSGFHKLTGDTSAAFTTPPQTNVVQFNAVTGSEDGSAVVSFTIDGGTDAKQWNISYVAEGEAEKNITFAGHLVTITGLTPGKEYKIKLSPVENILVTGTTEILHTASTLIKPVNLEVHSYVNGKLTASWSAPSGVKVDSWTVRCYDENGYNETKVVTAGKVTFENLEAAADYTIEVTAAGMSVGERAFVPKNAITVTSFKANTGNKNAVALSWKCANIPDGGWRILYSIDGLEMPEISVKDKNTIDLPNHVPGTTYTVSLLSANGATILGGKLTYETPKADKFDDYGIKSENLDFRMCKRPSKSNWDRHDVSSKDYTNTLDAGTKAAFVIKLDKNKKSSSDVITRLFVVRDERGNIVSINSNDKKWSKMWSGRYCAMNIPELPDAGDYTISVYFDGALASEQTFKVK